MYSKQSVYGEPATYSGLTRYLMKTYIEEQTHHLIQKHRLRWLGHVLRMPQDYIPKVALRWTLTGKRNRGRPKTTWKRTISTELSDMGLTMGEAQVNAQDRHSWRRDIGMKRISK